MAYTSYTVIYRIGGTERFEWRKCAPVATHDEAKQQREEIERMGYKALVHRSEYLATIGLPETYGD